MLLAIILILNVGAFEDQLKMVIEICRHGARSPITMKYNVTKTKWARGLGMLTELGMRQHYLLGKKLRELYID